MPLTIKPKDRPSLTPADVEEYSGGAVTQGKTKKDRAEAEANGTAPEIPYYRIGYRTVRYRPSDIDAYLESQRVS